MLTLKHGLIASSLSVLNQLIRRFVGIASLIILARVLTPEDFGLVAIALIFLNFVDVVTKFGGRGYLLSRETINDQQVCTNWTLGFLIRNSVAILLAIASFFIVDFYDDARLQPIIFAFVFQIFLSTLGSPGLIYKHKNQELGAIVRWQIISRFITTGITIYIAVIYKTYWALVIGQVLVVLSHTAASYFIAPMWPRFTLANVSHQWKFSKWIMPQSILNFFRSQIDAIYVSGIFDKATMGAYNSMRYYANIPATVVIKPVISTTLTQFSEFKNNLPYFNKQLQVAFFGLSAVAAPAAYLLMKHDVFIVGLVLGEKWVEYASLLGIFGFLIIVVSINSIISQIVMLKDATQLLLLYSVITILCQVIMFYFVDFISIYQLAEYKVWLDIATATLFYTYVICKLLSPSSLFFVSQPIALSVLCTGLAGVAMTNIPPLGSSFLDFIVQCMVFALVYLILQVCVLYLLRNKLHSASYVLSKSQAALLRFRKS